MSDYKIERVSFDDPTRCQSPTECYNKAVPGCTNCVMHGGARQLTNLKKNNLKKYQLTKFQNKISQKLIDTDAIVSLKEEVGMLSVLLEELWNHCSDSTELLLRSGPISDLLMKMQKLVVECQRLEDKKGNTLDKSKIVQFAQVIIEIIDKKINQDIFDKDTFNKDDLLDSISDEIFNALEQL